MGSPPPDVGLDIAFLPVYALLLPPTALALFCAVRLAGHACLVAAYYYARDATASASRIESLAVAGSILHGLGYSVLFGASLLLWNVAVAWHPKWAHKQRRRVGKGRDAAPSRRQNLLSTDPLHVLNTAALVLQIVGYNSTAAITARLSVNPLIVAGQAVYIAATALLALLVLDARLAPERHRRRQRDEDSSHLELVRRWQDAQAAAAPAGASPPPPPRPSRLTDVESRRLVAALVLGVALLVVRTAYVSYRVFGGRLLSSSTTSAPAAAASPSASGSGSAAWVAQLVCQDLAEVGVLVTYDLAALLGLARRPPPAADAAPRGGGEYGGAQEAGKEVGAGWKREPRGHGVEGL